ncbi:MAG TPA: oxidative damage protection protein [Thermoanaerobaculia bacterium]|nr:oxidative damage protection protein [Thermoanaerobaculia bacterium]
MSTVVCRRCGQQRQALARAPLPGPLGQQLRDSVCAACWQEWEQAEVMVINELRLNFMDPEAQETLEQQMREFLRLEPASG